MVKISVIIPIYNVEDYIEETLESLVNQTIIDEIEVIMIDDGSSDDSRFIIEKYALDYDNFYAFHKENEGQGATRNYGLTLAKGEYIHFMDADDYLPEDAYEKLFDMAKKNDFKNDIVLGNVLRFRRYNAWDSILYKNCFKDISQDIDSTNLNETQSIIWDTSAGNKLYKKEFLEKNDIGFIEDKTLYEDILFSFESYLCTDSIAIIHDIIYYWRVRKNNSSTTQQLRTTKNLKDRLKILNLCHDLMDNYNIDDEIRTKIYIKWLKNDLKIYLKGINDFPEDQISNLLDDVNKLLKLIPNQLKEDLNSYLKISYKMIENSDIDSLLYFAPLEKELKSNPKIPTKLDEKYAKYIDFEKDGLDEDLEAEVVGVSNDKEKAYLEFSEKINYISHDDPHESEAFLIVNSNEIPLAIEKHENNVIVLPLNLLKDGNHLQIKMIYRNASGKWESLLRSERRNSLSFDNVDIDIGIGYNHLLYIDVQNKVDNEIEITDMNFEDNSFKIRGIFKNNISQIFIQNVLNFKKIYYDVEDLENNKFICSIPYEDILKAEVKKWELNSNDSLNSIKLTKKFKFFTKSSVITFTNTRNKILITEDIQNPIDGLNELYEKSMDLKIERRDLIWEKRRLNKKINKLNKEIGYLNNRIDEFKARKVVRLADKLHLK